MSDAGVKLVAAIDIGTTYSRYAYGFLNDKREVSVPSIYTWNTLSSLLLDKDGKFVAFGEKAEEKYIESTEKDKTPILFRGFKKELYNNPTITRNTSVKDVSGQHAAPVVKILTMSIWYMKNQLMRTLNTSSATYNEDEVHFVLTVPSIWNNKAKAAMRLAALNADIKPVQLTIALDAECASLFYQANNTDMQVKLQTKGTQYAIVNIGGGTVDIAVHQSVGDCSVENLHYPCGGNWGGSTVVSCFHSYLCLVFGAQVMEEYIKVNSADFLKMVNDFDLKRRNLTTNMRLAVSLPNSLSLLTRQKRGFKSDESLRRHIATSKIFEMRNGELIIESHSLRGMFDYGLNCLGDELDSVFKKSTLNNMKHVLVVGGLAESTIVQERLSQMLKTKYVTFPGQSAMSVVKGAVLYGTNTELVRTRIVKLTYGLQRTEPYEEAKHKGGEIKDIGGRKMCTNVFHVLLKGETAVKTGQTFREKDKPLTADQTEQLFEIYTSGKTDEIPKLTSDQTVNKEASFAMPLPKGVLVADKEFELCSLFGETEVRFEVKILKVQTECSKHYLQLM